MSSDDVERELLGRIPKIKSLTTGAAAAGAAVHTLPKLPKDIEDDGQFHYAVLEPKVGSDSGKPSAEARRFIEEKTGPDSPRVYRNAVVLTVPSRDGLDAARTRIREYLGWKEVQGQLQNQEVDQSRLEKLKDNLKQDEQKIPEAIQQAYCIVVTVSEKNEVQAFKITVKSDEPLFNLIKADRRSRIQETAVTAETLLPGGPYDLWREDEPSRRVKDNVQVTKPVNNVLVTEADLQPNQIQDLADAITDIKNAAAGIDLKFRLRIELGGELPATDEAIAQINQLLQDTADFK